MQTILSNSVNELVVKNSRFITLLIKIDDDSNIKEIINGIKIEYPKATHYCYAYITENYKKSSDDGEPGGTAGMPILNVLEKEKIMNVLAVVIRYFGGIKLGAGGLVRAYSKSTKEAIKKAEKKELMEGLEIEITFKYEEEKKINYLLKESEIINKEFRETIKYNVLIKKEDLDKLTSYNLKIIKELLIKKQ